MFLWTCVNENKYSNKYMYIYVHSNSGLNSLKVKIISPYFLVWGIYWASWIFVFVIFIKLESFESSFSPYSSCSSSNPVSYSLGCLILPYNSLIFLFIFLNSFFLCVSFCLTDISVFNFTSLFSSSVRCCCCCCYVTSVVSDSVRPHSRQPTRLLRPWDSPGKNTGVGCHFLLQCMKVKSESEAAQSCLTLRDPMDCSPPGSSVHGIFQARVLEWGAIAFSTSSVWFAINPNSVFSSKALSVICIF